eukprot:TRINITY_DN25248_c0_g1_i2.p1 TRINITY_DN25248_c0_g1~~TRINITY_DN25248_c0_g1_i2.p1  ORF type:complete len:593 (+),score=120.45 TRINITY_DN25248_c0_g1_i2:79-1857(+)
MAGAIANAIAAMAPLFRAGRPEEIAEGVMNGAQAVLAFCALRQDRTHHSEDLHQAGRAFDQAERALHVGMEHASKLHEEQQQLERDLHADSMRMERQALGAATKMHLDSKKYSLRLFHKELAHAQQVSRKETIRDSLVQEAQRAQAIMVVESLMLGLSITMLVEGEPSVSAPKAITLVYSIALYLALGLLTVALWFATNLQSKILKYKIHDPSVWYGAKQLQAPHFTVYYNMFCRGVYRLTCCTLWLGTGFLLTAGTVLLAAVQKYDYHNIPAACVSIVGLLLLMTTLVVLVTQYWEMKTGPSRPPEADFWEFERFIRETRREIHRYDDECDHCRLPTELYFFCPVLNRPHSDTRSNRCPDCHFEIGTADQYDKCPMTGLRHPTPVGSPVTKAARAAGFPNLGGAANAAATGRPRSHPPSPPAERRCATAASEDVDLFTQSTGELSDLDALPPAPRRSTLPGQGPRGDASLHFITADRADVPSPSRGPRGELLCTPLVGPRASQTGIPPRAAGTSPDSNHAVFPERYGADLRYGRRQGQQASEAQPSAVPPAAVDPEQLDGTAAPLTPSGLATELCEADSMHSAPDAETQHR